MHSWSAENPNFEIQIHNHAKQQKLTIWYSTLELEGLGLLELIFLVGVRKPKTMLLHLRLDFEGLRDQRSLNG